MQLKKDDRLGFNNEILISDNYNLGVNKRINNGEVKVLSKERFLPGSLKTACVGELLPNNEYSLCKYESLPYRERLLAQQHEDKKQQLRF